jgi:GNAT superfamily N-acetyltransferase
MKFQIIPDPVEFREMSRELLTDEARHNLILGVLGHIISQPGAYEDYRLFVVDSGGRVEACGLMTVPYRVIVADIAEDDALSTLVDGLAHADFSVPGVIGNRPTVDRFVEMWSTRTGQSAELAMAQGVFALDEVRPPARPCGSARVAVESDLQTVFEWFNAFVDEAMPDEPRDDERLRTTLLKRLRGEIAGRVWLWEVEGSATSMSAYSGPTGSGVRVNAVYTPPEHRANGYASALVAAQSQWLLDNGHDFCFLFTDLANPTSNKIYESIGYHRVAEAASYNFSPAT